MADFEDWHERTEEEDALDLGERLFKEDIAKAGGKIKRIRSKEEWKIDGPAGEFTTSENRIEDVYEIDQQYTEQIHRIATANGYVVSQAQPIEAFCSNCHAPVVSKRVYHCSSCRRPFCSSCVDMGRIGETTVVRCNECLWKNQTVFIQAVGIVAGIVMLLCLLLF